MVTFLYLPLLTINKIIEPLTAVVRINDTYKSIDNNAGLDNAVYGTITPKGTFILLLSSACCYFIGVQIGK